MHHRISHNFHPFVCRSPDSEDDEDDEFDAALLERQTVGTNDESKMDSLDPQSESKASTAAQPHEQQQQVQPRDPEEEHSDEESKFDNKDLGNRESKREE